MMQEITLLIFLTSLVTYLPRVLPVWFLSQRKLPPALVLFLKNVPVAVLAALLAPALFAPEQTLTLSFSANPVLWVSIPVFILSYFTRNLFATVLFGMALLALLRYFG